MPVHRGEVPGRADLWEFAGLGSCLVPGEGSEPGEACFLDWLLDLELQREKRDAEEADQVVGA
jgi:hypothetical protein